METTDFLIDRLRPGRLRISRTVTHLTTGEEEALITRTAQAIERQRGGILGSGVQFPGRYTRWT
jgi:hypothetical protein